MKKVKKLVALAVASIMVMGVLTGCGSSNESSDKGGENTTTETGDQDTAEKTIKVGVCLYKFDDTYISTVRQNLTKIQEENKGKVEFEFFDGKGDQSVQNDMIDTLLQKNYDLLMVNLVDIGAGQTVVDKIKTSGVPVVLFNREPSVDVIKSYEDAVFVGTNASEAGVMQGKILSDLWNANKDAIDKNKDGVMQYVMFQGEPDNPEAVARTKYSVETIEEASIKTEKLELQPCNWQQDLAQTTMEAWLANHGDKIEVVIANNDGMALGAVAALQNQGYNKGDESKFIPVVGVDAVDAAKDYIEKGYMTGSVLQDAEGMAKALYEIGMNLAQDKSAIDGTSYEFDDTGVSVRIPYQPYVK
ncbi:galactose ABC transporter substrate-binding protein [Clostridium sp. NSJ-6]|uniref:D-galactose/methyl-galactoside binding periplasmic protein MglB n=1 Tax=Clostridium hominis TaxID=2763036 RepID=A0ABR7DJH0_9CLOT|nr:galactose ABC transporter substrate-binding protein [Clostridium hominis]MBC5631122.1 galactose ABC transporter substrate-binding protein [Clostridium hominis]MDU2671203.1 galactose ABC transporter substrate-binding protein [Clostridium sp.]